MRELDRQYVDHHGIRVHVIGYDSDKRQVIFMRDGYPHECMQPLEQFRKKFRRVDLAHEPLNAIQADSDKS